MTLVSLVSLNALLLLPFGKLVTRAASNHAQLAEVLAAWPWARASRARAARMKRDAGKNWVPRVLAAWKAPP
ncbi:hypothetical protein D3C78_1187500 [compost metagenome]